MSENLPTQRPPRGVIKAAKLLVKREREGKITIVIPDQMRQIADIDDEYAEPIQRPSSLEK